MLRSPAFARCQMAVLSLGHLPPPFFSDMMSGVSSTQQARAYDRSQSVWLVSSQSRRISAKDAILIGLPPCLFSQFSLQVLANGLKLFACRARSDHHANFVTMNRT